MSQFKRFFDTAKNGMHRRSDEDFLRKEASEKLYHLKEGDSLLDFGCGSAELTVYYAPHFSTVVAADFSENMLTLARDRAASFGLRNIEFLCANDEGVWGDLNAQHFTAITTAAVMQYLSIAQIEKFVGNARRHLQPGGRIAFFDLLDPRIYTLFRLGLLGARKVRLRAYPGVAVRAAKMIGREAIDLVRGQPSDIIGYRHHPEDIRALAQRQGCDVEIVCSMYYEYRYHAILVPVAAA